jgi:hypothetical protein
MVMGMLYDAKCYLKCGKSCKLQSQLIFAVAVKEKRGHGAEEVQERADLII